MSKLIFAFFVLVVAAPLRVVAQSPPAIPRLSPTESVRFLATFVDALSAIHQKQKQLDALRTDDFVERMTVLRVLSGETTVRRLAIAPFAESKNEQVKAAASTMVIVLDRYKVVYDATIGLYEQAVRIFTVPHELTESETKALAESRITTSQLSALSTQLQDVLKDVAALAFGSTIVPAPGDQDHIALDMTAGERNAFAADLQRSFGDLEKEKTLPGVDLAAYILQAQFAKKDWRLAK